MAEFTVRGPFVLKTITKASGARQIDVTNFWKNGKILSALRKRSGVYVFSVKPPRTKTYTPYYVGQAKNTFEQECFADRNLRKYESALNDYRKGAGVMFFLEHPRTKVNEKQIKELEQYLIVLGYAVNEDIENDQNAKLPEWSIRGIVRSSSRKPSVSAKHLSKMFEIKSKKGV